ncbi:Coenzyme A disulfide reductase [Streptomyces microflavus]
MVIGGDAAGMSAASQARRLKGPDELEIIAFERSRFTSYSACGIPYWVSGDVGHRDDLIARTPEEHRERAIDLRMRTEVTEIDVAGRRVRALDRESGDTYWTGFDKLVIATGARPVRPELPGIDAPGVHGVQTLGDGQALLDSLDAVDAGRRRRAVVVGAGYIGVEMAEAMLKRGFEVTVLNRGEQPMATLDPDMGRLVHDAMDGLGITTVNGASVTKILTGPDGRVSEVATDERTYPADVVVLGIGVEPEAELAREAGLTVGPHGGLLTDLAASTLWRRTGCSVISVTSSGIMQESSIAMPSRTFRYSGSERPACRMNQTGVCGTGSRRQALRNAESWVASLLAAVVVCWPEGLSLALTHQIFARTAKEPGAAGVLPARGPRSAYSSRHGSGSGTIFRSFRQC